MSSIVAGFLGSENYNEGTRTRSQTRGGRGQGERANGRGTGRGRGRGRGGRGRGRARGRGGNSNNQDNSNNNNNNVCNAWLKYGSCSRGDACQWDHPNNNHSIDYKYEDSNSLKDITCFNCGESGHIARDCQDFGNNNNNNNNNNRGTKRGGTRGKRKNENFHDSNLNNQHSTISPSDSLNKQAFKGSLFDHLRPILLNNKKSKLDNNNSALTLFNNNNNNNNLKPTFRVSSIEFILKNFSETQRNQINTNWPPSRSSHSITETKDFIFIIAGKIKNHQNNNNQANADMWSLDINSGEWTCMPSPPMASLFAHTCVHCPLSSGAKLILFGGEVSNRFSNQLYAFDLVFGSWSVINVNGANSPVARAYHSMIYLEENILVFGGFASDQSSLNDLWRYDIKANTWTKCNTTGNGPTPRGYHKALVFDNHMIVYGGTNGVTMFNDLYSLNLVSMEWIVLSTNSASSNAPSLNIGFSCFLVGSELITMGGQNPADDINPLNSKVCSFDLSSKARGWRVLNKESSQGESLHSGPGSGECLITDLPSFYDSDILVFPASRFGGDYVPTEKGISSEQRGILFAGMNETNQPQNNLYTITFTSLAETD